MPTPTASDDHAGRSPARLDAPATRRRPRALATRRRRGGRPSAGCRQHERDGANRDTRPRRPQPDRGARRRAARGHRPPVLSRRALPAPATARAGARRARAPLRGGRRRRRAARGRRRGRGRQELERERHRRSLRRRLSKVGAYATTFAGTENPTPIARRSGETLFGAQRAWSGGGDGVRGVDSGTRRCGAQAVEEIARSPRCTRRSSPQPTPAGYAWLDVGCGTELAFLAAATGAKVTGRDLARARRDGGRQAAERGLDIPFEVGEDESLPYKDAGFDVVTSSVGAIFAPDQRAPPTWPASAHRGASDLTAWTWTAGSATSSARPLYPPPPPGSGSST